MPAERLDPTEIVKQVVAARFVNISYEQSEAFGSRIARVTRAVHLESDSFLLTKSDASGV